MTERTVNPPITPLLRVVTAVEVLVLLAAGGGLFFLPATIGALWPWALTPFNTRFLGALYLASLASALVLVVSGHWSPARVVTPLILLFTTIVLVVSLLYFDRFVPSAWQTLAWFILYIGIPLNAAYHVWLYRRLAPANRESLPPILRTYLLVQAVVLGLYGLSMLVAPATFGAFWPWKIDDFHGRMYSVAFLTPALGAWFLYRAASPAELLALGVTQIVGGALELLGLFLVDSAVKRVDWSAAGTWVWVGLCATVLLSGLWMLWQARRSAG
jgi:hypothetical protein